jgi:DNA-binding PadR family transcriptional regulator
MPRMPRSNPLALAVLVSLYERPMHPYEIAHTLRSRAKHESVRLNYGSLYGVVESLERRGLIQALETTRIGRHPERTTYAITDAGASEAMQWLAELIAIPQKEYPKFMAGLSFLPALPPEDVATMLRDRAQAIETRLVLQRGAIGAATEVGLPRLFSLEAEYEIAMAEAELGFVRALLDELESGSLDGLDLWKSFHTELGTEPGATEFAFELGKWPVPDSKSTRRRGAGSEPRTSDNILNNHNDQGE